MKADLCKGCGKEIAWIRTSKDKIMPVDLPGLKVMVAVKDPLNQADPVFKLVDGYVSHFATCPAAASFRKPRKEQSPDA